MAGKRKNRVAVVVPMHNRNELTPDEQISFRHLTHYLKDYDKYLIAPESLSIDLPGCAVRKFGNEYFGSGVANTRLLLSEHFYASFSEYQYMLIYHLDALVFSDQLRAWCDAGLDYIGPPWIPCADSPWVKEARVGNGGLSLRRIDSFLKVCRSRIHWMDPEEYWKSQIARQPSYMQALLLPKKIIKQFSYFNNARREMNQWHLRLDGSRNEDHFWSDRAKHYMPEFKVATVEMGLRFAFEVAPRLCFELNHECLPFGCHAWPRYDRDFWEPYLLKSQVT